MAMTVRTMSREATINVAALYLLSATVLLVSGSSKTATGNSVFNIPPAAPDNPAAAVAVCSPDLGMSRYRLMASGP